MAIFIPNDERYIEYNGYAEFKVSKALHSLSDDWYIFHSLEWKDKVDGKFTNGENDYVLFNIKRGLISLEVKGGSISLKDRIFYQKNRKEGTEKIIDPMKQADDSKYRIIKELSNINSKYTIQSAVWFTDIDEIPNNLPINYAKEIVLTSKALNNPKKALENIFDYYNMKEIPYVTRDDIKNVLNKLSPCFNITESLKSYINKEKEEFIRLTNEQINILNMLSREKYISIKGSAGTGKTTVAIEKAKRLAMNKEKVLFLCYNKFLAESLSEIYSEMLPNISFMNINTLLYQMNGNKYLGDNYDELALDLLMNYKQHNFEYKHIIVDEGQDIQSDYLELLYEIAKEKDGVFYLFYDKNQLINLKEHEGKNNWKDPVNKVDIELTINCRNTKNIANISYESIKNRENININNNIIGEKVDFSVVSNKDEQLKKLEEILTEYIQKNFSRADIVIISLKSEKKSSLNEINKIGTHKLVKNLSKVKTNILKTTARKYKGLESDIVIIIDLDNESINDEEIEKLFYVSSSRAKHILHIISEKKLNEIEFLNINNIKGSIK